MANMHLENYAPLEGEAGGGGEEEASRFVVELQDAVTAIKKHHLSRFPANVDFTPRGLRWLAARCGQERGQDGLGWGLRLLSPSGWFRDVCIHSGGGCLLPS